MKWIILEWVGRWTIPTTSGGGVPCGPYESRELAEQTVTECVDAESRWRHAVVEVPWPKFAPCVCGAMGPQVLGERGWPECSSCGMI